MSKKISECLYSHYIIGARYDGILYVSIDGEKYEYVTKTPLKLLCQEIS